MLGLTPYNRRGSNLTRRDDIFDLRNFIDDFFGASMFPAFVSSTGNIRSDVRETDKEYIVEAEIPGAKKEDIKLDLRDDVLTISVEHSDQINEEKENYIRKERRFDSYSRSFYVENIKNEDVTAKYENGLLTVTLPKSEGGKEKGHRIEVQ